MKNAKLFFYRLDIIKKVVFGISLVIVFIAWFIPTNYFFIYGIGIPAEILLLLSILPLPVPSDSNVAKEVQAAHRTYITAITNERKCTEKELLILDGFSDKRLSPCRPAGSIDVYPVCRTVILAEKDGRLYLYQKDTPLLGEGEREVRFVATREKKLTAAFENTRRANIIFSLENDDGRVSVCMRMNYRIRELLDKYQPYLHLDESSREIL